VSTDTASKYAVEALAFFEAKLLHEISPYGLKTAIANHDPMQIIDVRKQEAFDHGHIPGADNVPLVAPDNFTGALSEATLTILDNLALELNAEQPVIVYCYDIYCRLAARVAIYLIKKGFVVKELYGGWDAWAQLNFEKVDSICATDGANLCG
jgi:rhodanese-related sulfurtransferase